MYAFMAEDGLQRKKEEGEIKGRLETGQYRQGDMNFIARLGGMLSTERYEVRIKVMEPRMVERDDCKIPYKHAIERIPEAQIALDKAFAKEAGSLRSNTDTTGLAAMIHNINHGQYGPGTAEDIARASYEISAVSENADQTVIYYSPLRDSMNHYLKKCLKEEGKNMNDYGWIREVINVPYDAMRIVGADAMKTRKTVDLFADFTKLVDLETKLVALENFWGHGIPKINSDYISSKGLFAKTEAAPEAPALT
jgi:hypothetical protein